MYKRQFQTDVTSTLTQLSVEQDFLTGGDDNIFGETKESCLAAIDQVLERIENPLAAVTEERAAYLQQEKEFYTVLAVSYTHLDVYKRQA